MSGIPTTAPLSMPTKTMQVTKGPQRIVNTCTFVRDYPNEKFLNLPTMTHDHAQKVVDAINDGFNSEGSTCSRYWKVVPADYELKPGFEP